MKVILIGIICIVWVQSSSAKPKWTGLASVDPVDDSEPQLDMTAEDQICPDYKTGHHDQRPKDLDYKTVHGFLARIRKKPPSNFWTVMTAVRGIYVLWMFLLFLSWSMNATENSDPDLSEDDGNDTTQPPADDQDSDTVQFFAVEGIPVADDVLETVIDVIQMMMDVVVVAENLAEDVVKLVDKDAGDGFSPEKFVSGDLPTCEHPGIVTGDHNSHLFDGTKPESSDGAIVIGCSTCCSEESSSDCSMHPIRPDESGNPGTSLEPERHTDGESDQNDLEDPVEKPNIFQRAKKAVKKWKKSLGRKMGRSKDHSVADDDEPLLEQQKRTLEEINRMWSEEKVPSLRKIPKVHFRQRVEVKTFLVKKPMARYVSETIKNGPSEVTEIRRLKKEGEFEEVGFLPTGNGFRLRLLRGAMKLGRAFGEG